MPATDIMTDDRFPRQAGIHRFGLDEIEAACDLFASQRDRVVKVAITSPDRARRQNT
jgi:hypothetical protein